MKILRYSFLDILDYHSAKMTVSSCNKQMLLTGLEHEVAVLLSARKMISGMVNKSVLSFSDDSDATCVCPNTLDALYLFCVFLVDFISKMKPPLGEDRAVLDELDRICKSPEFNVKDSISSLGAALNELDGWLGLQVTIPDLWLPSINKELSIQTIRKDIIYICGNTTKHNIFRLDGVMRVWLRILRKSDETIDLKDAYLSLDDFQQRIMDDILPYHLSRISQMLNDIAWGIQDYLLPEYKKSYTVDEERSRKMSLPMYRFKCPAGITTELGKVYHWDLMNEIRSGPVVQRFKPEPYLVGRY